MVLLVVNTTSVVTTNISTRIIIFFLKSTSYIFESNDVLLTLMARTRVLILTANQMEFRETYFFFLLNKNV